MRALAIALALIGSAGAAQDTPLNLNLVCGGAGFANRATSSHAYATDSDGNSGSATITGTRSVDFADEVRLAIQGDEGRVQMPRTMLPLLHGGTDGWFDLKNIRATNEEIAGTVAINVINHPKLRLNRYSGAINIEGKAGNYSGHCQQFSAEHSERRF